MALIAQESFADSVLNFCCNLPRTKAEIKQDILFR